MQPGFKPPATEAEFNERAAKLTLPGAVNMLSILERRRAEAVKPIDAEIAFYKKVIKNKES